jgi:hypothetical protein
VDGRGAGETVPRCGAAGAVRLPEVANLQSELQSCGSDTIGSSNLFIVMYKI